MAATRKLLAGTVKSIICAMIGSQPGCVDKKSSALLVSACGHVSRMAEPLNAIEGASIEGKQLRDADKAQCFSAMRNPGGCRQILELKMLVSPGNCGLFTI